MPNFPGPILEYLRIPENVAGVAFTPDGPKAEMSKKDIQNWLNPDEKVDRSSQFAKFIWALRDNNYSVDEAITTAIEHIDSLVGQHFSGDSGKLEKDVRRLYGKPRLTPSLDAFDDLEPEGVIDDRPLTWAELNASDFEPPKFAWDGFVLENLVNLLYGDGGTGKTLLALHIAAAVAAGASLFGRSTKQMPALLVLAEDDYGETKARLKEIQAMLKIPDSAELPIHTWCRPGYESILAVVNDKGVAQKGTFLPRLQEELKKIGGPCFLVLDTVSDIAALNEWLRLPVNTFCKTVLGGLCREYGATILVNCHPSKTSMEDGTAYSGSTAWNNSVRNRLSFERLAKDGGPERLLRVAKANYGPEHEIQLTLNGRLLLPPDSGEVVKKEGDETEHVLLILREMRAKGIRVVRRVGDGQKALNIAQEIGKRFGLISEDRVKEILDKAERDGVIRYVESTPGRGGLKATYEIVEFDNTY